LDVLTLKSSLRAAEMWDLAEHRAMRLQGEARICERWGLGQSPNGKYLILWLLGVSASKCRGISEAKQRRTPAPVLEWFEGDIREAKKGLWVDAAHVPSWEW
jgi:hypothetical protein